MTVFRGRCTLAGICSVKERNQAGSGSRSGGARTRAGSPGREGMAPRWVPRDQIPSFRAHAPSEQARSSVPWTSIRPCSIEPVRLMPERTPGTRGWSGTALLTAAGATLFGLLGPLVVGASPVALTPADCARLFTRVQADGLSPATARHIRGDLRPALNRAVKDGAGTAQRRSVDGRHGAGAPGTPLAHGRGQAPVPRRGGPRPVCGLLHRAAV